MTLPDLLRRGFGKGLAGLALLALVAGNAAAQDSASVWSVKGKRNTVYFAGSVHALPSEQAHFPEQLERAYQAADAVMFEVDLDNMDPVEAIQFITSNGTLPADRALKDVVGEENYPRVAQLATELGLPEHAIARLEPWAAALILTQFALNKSGFDPALGIDMQLTARAKADGKPVGGLETVVEQLSVFDDRSFEEQTRFLLDSTDDAPNLQADLDNLIRAWRTGDMRALEKEFEEERARSPALYDALLGKRNRNWMPKLIELFDSDQDHLVVVGTLHFVGEDGLLTLLRQEGFKAVPLPPSPKPGS